VQRDPAALATALGRLAALLQEADMAATDVFAELQRVHEPAWPEALAPLADAMGQLDFDRALQACQGLQRHIAGLPVGAPS